MMSFLLVIGGAIIGGLIAFLFFPKVEIEEVEKVVEKTVSVPATVFIVKNENKNSASGADKYLGIDVYEKPSHKMATRLMFTEREFNIGKKRAKKNKDEVQP